MKTTPMVKSKFYMPELPRHVLHSERIRGLPIAHNRAVTLTAPGGYGKTTSVLLALQNQQPFTHWYRMEKEDRFLPVFYAHVMHTLFHETEEEMLECKRGLSSVHKIQEEYPLINALLCQDAWQVFPDEEAVRYLVFDDFHHVIGNPLISETVDYLVSNLPPSFRIIIMSREEPGVLSDQCSLMENSARISTDDLRFTLEESLEFIQRVHSGSFSEPEAQRIHTCSEGWIAGLHMICHSENPMRHMAGSAAELGDCTKQPLFTHFFNRYLEEMDQSRLMQLADLSILYDFSEATLEEVFHIQEPATLLSWLEDSNLYIQKIVAHPTRYRFHSLFRNELENYLRKTRSSTYIKNLYERAARFYDQSGELRTAIRFYLAADQTDAAIRSLSYTGSKFFAQGKPEQIMYLTAEFPDKVVESSSYLQFYKGLVLLTQDIDEAYSCLRTALLMFKQENDLSYMMNAFGMILVMSFQTNDFRYVTEVVPSIPKVKVLLNASAPRRKLVTSGFIGVVADEKLITGTLMHRIVEKFKVPEPVWDYSFLMIQGMLFYRTGKLKAASEILPLVLSHPVGLASDQWRATGLIACHNTLWLQRKVHDSKKIMEEFAALAEKYESDFYRSFALRLSGIIKYQTRDVPGAVADLQEVANCYVRYGSPILANSALLTKYLWETELTPAQRLLPEAEASFSHIPSENAGHGYYELCQTMMGAIYKAAGDYEKAEPLLLSAYNTSKRKGTEQHLSAVAMHLADLCAKMKHSELFEKYLLIWAKKSSQAGYVFFHEMDYNTLIRVCSLAMEKELFHAHIMKIIGTYFGLEAAHHMSENPTAAYSDSQKFLDQFSGTTKIKPVIRVTLLGTFAIQKDDIIIKESSWKTRKVSGILKYILANPDKYISRELLSTVFWPDSNSKAASTSLRVALYELRKNLSSYGMGFADEHALIIEDENGFHVGSRIIVETDTDKFNQLYDLYKSQSLSDEATINTLEKMVQLYTGDFLEDCSYGDWSLSQEHYRSKYIEVSQALSVIKIKSGDLKEAEMLLEKHMGLDPYDEKGCALLIKTYEATGQKARAVSFARQFKKKFSAEIGASPNIEFPG